MTEQFDESVGKVLRSLGAASVLPGMLAANTAVMRNTEKNKPQQRVEAPAQQASQAPVPDEVERENPPKIEDVPTRIFNKLTKEGGLRPEAAVGILANLDVESRLNPAAEQGNGGPGRGLAQWEEGGRFDTDMVNLKKFAKSKGKPWTDLDTQIDFIIHELDHPLSERLRRVKTKLNQAKTSEQAMAVFLRDYERASISHIDRRKEAVKKYAERFISN